MQKTDLEVQKAWYFPYSAFGRQANGGGYSTFPLATLLTAPPSDLMQLRNSGVGLGYNWDGDAEAFNVRVANKNYNIRGPYVVFEVNISGTTGSKRMESTPI